MPVSYTNRKGVTYYLCQTLTEGGRGRYFFSRQPKEPVIEEVPEGYGISESVNGRVSLVRIRPMLIRPEEAAKVEEALNRHDDPTSYRSSVVHNRIDVYERIGPGVNELLVAFERLGVGIPDFTERLTGAVDEMERFQPMLRFVLVDREARTFRAERKSYRGDRWIRLAHQGPVAELAARAVPLLGSRAFYRMV